MRIRSVIRSIFGVYDMKGQRISTAEASALTGIPEQAIRIMMQRDLVDFGTCTQLTGSRYSYYIMKNKVLRWIEEKGEEESENV